MGKTNHNSREGNPLSVVGLDSQETTSDRLPVLKSYPITIMRFQNQNLKFKLVPVINQSQKMRVLTADMRLLQTEDCEEIKLQGLISSSEIRQDLQGQLAPQI